jgi:hypothetical protein
MFGGLRLRIKKPTEIEEKIRAEDYFRFRAKHAIAPTNNGT